MASRIIACHISRPAKQPGDSVEGLEVKRVAVHGNEILANIRRVLGVISEAGRGAVTHFKLGEKVFKITFLRGPYAMPEQKVKGAVCVGVDVEQAVNGCRRLVTIIYAMYAQNAV
jgi:hypothetical protein